MSLNPTERLALQDAVRIANAVMAGDGDPMHVATALMVFAQLVVADDPRARYALALQLMSCTEELLGLHCIDLDEAASRCNGHVLNSR